MVLTARSAVGLIEACDEALENPSLAPSIADGSAIWPAAVATDVVKVVAGLTAPRKRNRMKLHDALQELTALTSHRDEARASMNTEVASPPGSDVAPNLATTASEDSERLCMICEVNAREVRFECGHACTCRQCLPLVLKSGMCPSCRTPFGAQPIREEGSHVGGAPTFQLGSGRGRGAAADARGQGGLGRGRGGRGRGLGAR